MAPGTVWSASRQRHTHMHTRTHKYTHSVVDGDATSRLGRKQTGDEPGVDVEATPRAVDADGFLTWTVGEETGGWPGHASSILQPGRL